MQPSISPDGKQIAFVSSRSGESDCLCFFVYGTDQPLMGGAIWIMPTFGGSPKKIVDNGTFPSWSPDGTTLIFTKGPWYGQKIFRVSSNGGDPQEIPLDLTENAPFFAYPSYSPDGKRIAFEAANKIFIVDAGGGTPQMIVEGKHPVWSADGGTIIYTNVRPARTIRSGRFRFPSLKERLPAMRSRSPSAEAATPRPQSHATVST